MKPRVYFAMVLAVLTVSALTACTPREAAAPAGGGGQPVQVAAEKGKSAAADWDRVVTEARREGQVTLYKASVYIARVSERFKEKYGVVVDAMTLNGGQIAERMSREYRAGIYNVDVISTGYGGVRLLKPLGMLAPMGDIIVLPEVLDSAKWVGGKFPIVDGHQVDFFGRVTSSLWKNTEMVREGEIKEYRDILNPRWKGKIILDDPQNSGAGTQWYRLYHQVLGEDFMRALIEQEPVVMRDKRLEVEWLARGKHALLIGGNMENLIEFRKAGAPINLAETKEGEYIGPGSGVVELAPRPAHPNATKLFINWILTKEAQTLLSEENLLPSLRTDVPTAHLDPDTVPKPGKTYLADTLETIARANEYMEASARIFAPLLKK
ncbi:MAG: ABC transporter substrate-binding protein [Chloroflexi bacterium]|nr:ABC transporter substrate-binding protein [Chloroflexota bacterium]